MARAAWPFLEPAATTLVTHEDVQLAIGSESHDAAIVVTVWIGIIRPWVAGYRDVVRLQRAQHDHVTVASQRGTVPDEAVDAVAEQGHGGVDRSVGAGAALGPADVHVRRRRKVRVQDEA